MSHCGREASKAGSRWPLLWKWKLLKTRRFWTPIFPNGLPYLSKPRWITHLQILWETRCYPCQSNFTKKDQLMCCMRLWTLHNPCTQSFILPLPESLFQVPTFDLPDPQCPGNATDRTTGTEPICVCWILRTIRTDMAGDSLSPWLQSRS
jgi:hypothetical protein